MKLKLVLLTLLSVFLLASCNLPGSIENIPLSGDEPLEAATDTLSVTFTTSDTPQPTFTDTPENVTISVSVDTNCRMGPGEVYDWVGGLMTGDNVQVYATDPTGHYWYIANPHGSGYCWVWGQFATPVGDIALLPIYTPLPTPTPIIDFELSFVGIDRCSAMRFTRLKIGNTGVLTWESFKAVITDLTTAETSSPMIANEFTDAYTCGTTTNVPALITGESAIVYTYGFGYDLPGHSMQADVTVCSQNGLLGACVTHSINFVP